MTFLIRRNKSHMRLCFGNAKLPRILFFCVCDSFENGINKYARGGWVVFDCLCIVYVLRSV